MPSPSIQNLDHLGLVAGMCRDLHIAEMVDAVIPKKPNMLSVMDKLWWQ